MAGDPPKIALSNFAQILHDRWELQNEAVSRRRKEDIDACRILGADYLHWAIPDCIYRHHPQSGEPYYTSNQDIFGPVHLADNALLDTLTKDIASLPAYGRIFVPLSVGNHVDHQITRLAAERYFGTELYYYEEYPYAVVPGAVNAVIADGGAAWKSETIAIPEEAMKIKIDAIAAFSSQLSTFFLDPSDLEKQVCHFTRTLGGERIWHYGYN